MKRLDCIKKIIKDLPKEVCIISSCGMVSRDVYAAQDRPRNFYMEGSMGNELAFGLGLAYTRQDLQVVVISGDGSALMHSNSSIFFQWLKQNRPLENLKHYILDNGCHATTGGQKTVGCISQYFIYSEIIKIDKENGSNPGNSPRIPLTYKEIAMRLKNEINRS